MKLTDEKVKWFEQEQKDYGTKVAMYNLIYTIASDILTDLGIKQIKTSDKDKR